jgi:1-acyl-sn-glycerol-3-phosphate acyltransferase
MAARLALWILHRFGWKITGSYPYHLPRLILAAAPHTSNWDFPLGVLARTAMRIRANFVGKHTLFYFPLGGLMRWLGGIPVDRTAKGGFVAQTVAAILKAKHAHIVIAPEGTRKKTDRLRTGFYHIAREAQIPIILVTFDWGNKIVDFGEVFHPTQHETQDLAYIWNYFKGVIGHTPENGII